MAKSVKILIFLCFCAIAASNAGAQELQLSFGLDANVGLYTVKNTIWHTDGNVAYYVTEDTENLFFSPGINFLMRVFGDTESKVSSGFVFKERLLLMTHANTTGYVDDKKVSEDLGIKDYLMMVVDAGLGISTRISLSQKTTFITDYGFNFTYMIMGDYDNEDELDYYGAGIFADIGFQFDVGKKVYLELGLGTTMNLFSSQEGKTTIFGPTVNYEDTGRYDWTTLSVYFNIGWRI